MTEGPRAGKAPPSPPGPTEHEGRIRVVVQSVPSAVRVDRVVLRTGVMGERITAALGSVLDESLINNATIAVLCSLERDGQVRPRDLQALTGMTSGGTTNLLDRLFDLDLVTRSHDSVSGDRRAVIVILTPRGRDTVAAIVRVFAAEAEGIRRDLEALDAELGGPEPETASHDGTELASGPARVHDDPRSVRAGSAEPVRILDAIIGLAQLGFSLRRALVAGLHPEVYMDNSVAIVLGSLLSGGPRRPRDLQPLLGLTSGGMTKLLLRIERSGLIALDRRSLEADRRATIVSITPQGRRAMAETGQSMAAHATEIRTLIHEIADALAR